MVRIRKPKIFEIRFAPLIQVEAACQENYVITLTGEDSANVSFSPEKTGFSKTGSDVDSSVQETDILGVVVA